MNIFLDKVLKDNKKVLYNLLQYSLFEESLYDGNEMNNEGVFEYEYFDNYFTDKDRYAFFVKEKESNKLLGFVMINTYVQKSTNGHSIAEFMILPKYRNKQIGKKTAFKCFDMFKGNWEVSPSYGSKQAYSFWKKVIDEYTNNNDDFIDGIITFNNKGM